MLALTLVFTLGLLALAFEFGLANSGTWFAYCGEEKEWLVPGRLFGGENVIVADGGWTPRWREQLRHCADSSLSRCSTTLVAPPPVTSSTLVARRWQLPLLPLLALLCTPLEDVSLWLLALLCPEPAPLLPPATASNGGELEESERGVNSSCGIPESARRKHRGVCPPFVWNQYAIYVYMYIHSIQSKRILFIFSFDSCFSSYLFITHSLKIRKRGKAGFFDWFIICAKEWANRYRIVIINYAMLNKDSTLSKSLSVLWSTKQGGQDC